MTTRGCPACAGPHSIGDCLLVEEVRTLTPAKFERFVQICTETAIDMAPLHLQLVQTLTLDSLDMLIELR